MKYLILMIILTGCAVNKIEQRREKVLDCTKELIEYDSGTTESYQVCKDLYSRSQK